MDFSSAGGLEALSKLICDASEEEEAVAPKPQITPASIGAPAVKHVGRAASTSSLEKKKKGNSKDIWDIDEVPDAIVAVEEAENIDDGRFAPEYEFLYKQAVTSQDAYLGMGEKDPSSTQCEDLVLRISLPGIESAAEVDLDVKPTYVKLHSQKYKLFLYLPHTVDEKQGSAKWDNRTEKLTVTLRIVRDVYY